MKDNKDLPTIIYIIKNHIEFGFFNHDGKPLKHSI